MMYPEPELTSPVALPPPGVVALCSRPCFYVLAHSADCTRSTPAQDLQPAPDFTPSESRLLTVDSTALCFSALACSLSLAGLASCAALGCGTYAPAPAPGCVPLLQVFLWIFPWPWSWFREACPVPRLPSLCPWPAGLVGVLHPVFLL